MPSNRKQQKKSKNGKVSRRQVGFGPLVQPQQQALRVWLPWSFSSSMSEAAAGAGVSYSLAINNAFDPNFTGVGAQPLAFDQYAALFSRYRVIGVKFAISFSNRTAQGERCGFFPSAQSTLTADVNAWVVQNDGVRMSWLAPTTGGPSHHEFKGEIDLPKYLGITKREFLTEFDFSAVTSAGPARTLYMHLFTVGNSGTVATSDFTVRLWLLTEFTSPVALGLS